jgi:hypothetical protein
MLFFGYALQYAQKINISVAIVCMINQTAFKLDYRDIQTVTQIINLNETNITELALRNELLNETERISDACLFRNIEKNTTVYSKQTRLP